MSRGVTTAHKYMRYLIMHLLTDDKLASAVWGISSLKKDLNNKQFTGNDCVQVNVYYTKHTPDNVAKSDPIGSSPITLQPLPLCLFVFAVSATYAYKTTWHNLPLFVNGIMDWLMDLCGAVPCGWHCRAPNALSRCRCIYELATCSEVCCRCGMRARGPYLWEGVFMTLQFAWLINNMLKYIWFVLEFVLEWWTLY